MYCSRPSYEVVSTYRHESKEIRIIAQAFNLSTTFAEIFLITNFIEIFYFIYFLTGKLVD